MARTLICIATFMLICSLATSLSVESHNLNTDGGLQHTRILAAKKGLKKNADLGPKRATKKSAKDAKAQKPAAKKTAKGTKNAAKEKLTKAAEAVAKNDQTATKINHLLEKKKKNLADTIKRIAKMRVKYLKMTGGKAKYLYVKNLIFTIDHTYKIKQQIRKFEKAAKENETAKKKNAENLKTSLKANAKANKIDPKTGKKIKPAPQPETHANKTIRMQGHAQRAKLMKKFWGKKVPLAADTKSLPVAHRYKSCVLKECSKVNAWEKNACKSKCRKTWGRL